jgi:hypothetical protein
MAVAHLYRKVNLNLSTPSHQRLLRKLASTGAGLWRHIRVLTVDGIEQGHLQPAFDVSLALTKLMDLEDLSFAGSVSFPQCMLSTLRNRHNNIAPDLQATVLSPGLPQPLYTSLTGLACPRLTHLEINVYTEDQIHQGFKEDMVQMLLRARSLRSLKICIGLFIDRAFPDSSSELDYGGLPRLEELRLFVETTTELFGSRELANWGAAGGWDNIDKLALGRPRDLFAFIGKVPKLEIFAYTSQQEVDVDEIESYLKATNCDAPLGH